MLMQFFYNNIQQAQQMSSTNTLFLLLLKWAYTTTTKWFCGSFPFTIFPGRTGPGKNNGHIHCLSVLFTQLLLILSHLGCQGEFVPLLQIISYFMVTLAEFHVPSVILFCFLLRCQKFAGKSSLKKTEKIISVKKALLPHDQDIHLK